MIIRAKDNIPPCKLLDTTCTRSGLLQERLLPLGGGGGGGNSASEASSGRWVARSVSASSLAPYSSSSSVLLHFDMEELHDTDL